MFAKDKISQSMIDAVNSVIENVDEIKVEVSMLSEQLIESEKGQKLKTAVSSFDRIMKNAEMNTQQQHIAKITKTAKEVKPTPIKKYMDGLDGVRRELPMGIGDNEHFSAKVNYNAESTILDEVLDSPSLVKTYLDKSAQKRKALAATGKLGDDSHRKISKSFDATHKVLNKEESFSSKILEAMKPTPTTEFSDMDEEALTPEQTKKKEEIVLSMKSKENEFKKKYGKNWQNVMYATATKMAMTESSDDNLPIITNEVTSTLTQIKKTAKEHAKRLKDE